MELKLLIACPKNCRDLKDREVPVYGSGPFHETSSICRSALYSEMYDDVNGGEIYIIVNPEGQKSYEGGMNNLVTSFGLTAKPEEHMFDFN